MMSNSVGGAAKGTAVKAPLGSDIGDAESSRWSLRRETPYTLKVALEAARSGDWGTQSDRINAYCPDFRHGRGRLGFTSDNWRPGLFLGFMLSGKDHGVALSVSDQDPDFCLLVNFDMQDLLVARYAEHPAYRRLVERLSRNPPPLGCEFVNQLQVNQQQGRSPNAWHPLILRKSMTSLFGNCRSIAGKGAAIREHAIALLEHLFAGGELDAFRQEFNEAPLAPACLTSGGESTPLIPKILHYCFGMAPDFGGIPWSLAHYACLKSAVERIKPEQVFFYYEYEPQGPWWQLTRPLITPVKIKAPREIFGNPLNHVALRADVVRLEKLIEHGGIYLDADVFVHRDFDDLLGHSCVLGREHSRATDGFGTSLCNAVILAQKGAPFLLRWLAEFQWSRSHWAEHGVRVPASLAKKCPHLIRILPHNAFFWPLYWKSHIDWLFHSTDPCIDDGSYATHLWEAIVYRHTPYLKDLTVARVRSVDSNFHRLIRPLLKELPDTFAT